MIIKPIPYILLLGVLGLTGCCDDNDKSPGQSAPPTAQASQQQALKDFSAEVSTSGKLENLKMGETVILPVVIKNTGTENWLPPIDRPINFGYHWLDETGQNPVVFDGIRTGLPQGLQAGAQIELQAKIQAPDTPGKYILRLTLVQETVAWFENKGMKPLDIVVMVNP
jgi:hypothetical protein